MILIVGLGNPGEKYAKTRHNVGWLVLERMLEKFEIRNPKLQTNSKFEIRKEFKSEIYETKIGDQRVVLAKPLTFMNNSGEVVRLLINSTRRVENPKPDGFSLLYIIHDDLDIPLGSFKIQFGKGPKEHKGIESVERALGTKDFWRVRVGIENRASSLKPLPAQAGQASSLSGEEYVLGEFREEELKVLEETMPKVIKRLKKEIKRGS